MQTFIEVSIALLPFAILIGGFLIFKMDALIVSAYALGAEAIVVCSATTRYRLCASSKPRCGAT